MANIKEWTDRMSLAFKTGGTAIGLLNPILGAGTAILGEFLPSIVEKINETRWGKFASSVNAHVNDKAPNLDVKFEDAPDKYEQILNTARKAMIAESDYTIFLMGKITAISLNEDRRYSQNELQLIDVLYRMNDYDCCNFIHICNQFEEVGKTSVDNEVLLDECDVHADEGATRDNILCSLKKLNILGLFDYSSTAVFGEEDMREFCTSNFYKMNSLTNDLRNLI